MPTQKITFEGHSGEMLAARLDMPAGLAKAFAIFAHCFTCTKDIPAAARVARKLSSLGVAVMRFDFTGLGHSEGEFANTHFSSNVEDLVRAAKFLADNYEAPSLLIGHSLGGAAVLRAAGEIPSVKAVSTIGAPADPEHVLHNFGCSLDEIAENGEAEVSLAGRPFTIRKSFVEDVAGSKLSTSIAGLRRALLVLHSPIDQTVGIENAGEIFSAAKHPKSFVTLDNADHLLTRAEDAEYAAQIIASWAARYLDGLGEELPALKGEAVRSTELDPDAFLQSIQTNVIATLADEPASYGGSDAGLSPFELVSAGLAACTAMTMRMYARRKDWQIDHLHVDVFHDKIHAETCAECETKEGKIDQFRREITLEGPLDEDQRARILAIADKCPVHRTLHSEIDIVTELVE